MTGRPGIVYLVGAGPGDPKLLTVRALERIAAAEVVAHDLLVPPEILALAPADAELIPVGRRRGSPRPGYRLHPAVLERARAGKRVVRLKSGDPFVFGRGGEEAEELAAHGIPFEVVPGVSAAFGAAARAGIPLTHRDLANSVSISTGHEAGESLERSGPRACAGTAVVYMAGRRLADVLARLVDEGRAPATPAAFVAAATQPGEVVVTGTLADLASRVDRVGPDAELPGLVIAGDVVRLSERLRGACDARPLEGRRILVARARPGPSKIGAGLDEAGASVLEAPSIEVHPPGSYEALDRELRELGGFDAVVFGSATAVERTLSRLVELGVDVRDLPRRPFVAVGEEAARRLAAAGIRAESAAPGACRDALSTLPDALVRGRRILVVDSEDPGRPNLVSELEGRDARVEYRAAFRHERRFRGPAPSVDLIVLPSSSAASGLLEGPWAAGIRGERFLAIGPQTELAARALGATRVTRSPADSVESVIGEAIRLLARDAKSSR